MIARIKTTLFKRSSNEEDILSQIPQELISQIIGYLDEPDIAALARVSRHFNALTQYEFFNTVYGKGLRFSEWQQKELKQCQKDIDQFIRQGKEEYRAFRQQGADQNPNNLQLQGINRDAKHFFAFAFLCGLALTYKLYNIYEETPTNANLGLVIYAASMVPAVYIAYQVMMNYMQRQCDRVGYMTSGVNQQQLNKFQGLLDKYHDLFSAVEDNTKPLMNSFLIQMLEFRLEETEKLANRFSEYLASKEGSKGHHLNLDDLNNYEENFSKESGKGLDIFQPNISMVCYAKSMASLWAKRHPQEEPLLAEEVEQDQGEVKRGGEQDEIVEEIFEGRFPPNKVKFS